jgi:hypothetical protein
MSDDELPDCPNCEKPVGPDAEGVVYAVERRDMPGFAREHDFAEGIGAFFHADRPPEAFNYESRPRPS